MYNKQKRKNIQKNAYAPKELVGVWSGDETIAPKGFRNLTREL